MKSIFEIIVMVWLGLTFLCCFALFSEEVLIHQQTIHVRNKVNEIIEINNGYTQEAENEINNLISNLKNTTTVVVSKRGKLNYGEKVEYIITVNYERRLPFQEHPQQMQYSVKGQLYNSNY